MLYASHLSFIVRSTKIRQHAYDFNTYLKQAETFLKKKEYKKLMKKEIVCIYSVTLSLRGNRNCQVGWCHGSECVWGLKWSETDYTIFMVTFQ